MNHQLNLPTQPPQPPQPPPPAESSNTKYYLIGGFSAAFILTFAAIGSYTMYQRKKTYVKTVIPGAVSVFK